MSNLITKYKDFLFEADNLQIEIDTAELELSKEEKKLIDLLGKRNQVKGLTFKKYLINCLYGTT